MAKLHIAIDAETLQIRAVQLTTNNVSDSQVLEDLLAQIPLELILFMTQSIADKSFRFRCTCCDSSRRNTQSAYRFLSKIFNNVKKWQIPRVINTDKAPTYGRALSRLKREGKCPESLKHQQIKYKNNVIECYHGKLKIIIKPMLGFKSMKTAYATIKGIEVMRALRKG